MAVHEKLGKQDTMEVNNHNNPIPTSLSKYKVSLYTVSKHTKQGRQGCRDGLIMIIDFPSLFVSLVFHELPSLHPLDFREIIFPLVIIIMGIYVVFL